MLHLACWISYPAGSSIFASTSSCSAPPQPGRGARPCGRKRAGISPESTHRGGMSSFAEPSHFQHRRLQWLRATAEGVKAMRRADRERERERALQAGSWLTEIFRNDLVGRLRPRLGDVASAEDMAQEVLLRTVLAVRRLDVVDPQQCERIAWRISQDLVVDDLRSNASGVRTSDGLDHLPFSSAEEDEFSAGAMRETLAALRPRLEPLLGRCQRILLAAFLEDGIAPISALAGRLRTDRANVRRMIKGIAKKILKLKLQEPPD